MSAAHTHAAISTAGSATATVGGGAAYLFAQSPLPGAREASTVALVIAIGGICTTVLPHVLAMTRLSVEAMKLIIEGMKAFLAAQAEARKSADARHELRNQLDAANYEAVELKETVAELTRTVEENRKLITLLAERHDAPTALHPDRPGEYRDAQAKSDQKALQAPP